MLAASDRIFRKVPVSLIVVLFFSLVSHSFAHRSPDEQRDPCRIQVGYEPMHFTAYTPTFSKSKQYCQNIPYLGLTNLVFDYDGKKLRQITIAFEVTKEPEGTRVFYQQPEKHNSGTFAKNVDLTPFGIGAYMAHITIVHKGKKLDTHLPFKVKPKSRFGFRLLMLIVLIIALGYGYKFYRARSPT
jgi:hypothetical protein